MAFWYVSTGTWYQRIITTSPVNSQVMPCVISPVSTTKTRNTITRRDANTARAIGRIRGETRNVRNDSSTAIGALSASSSPCWRIQNHFVKNVSGQNVTRLLEVTAASK